MTFEELQQKVLTFRDDRDWSQFHNPKDLALSISLEAAELLECFQWSGDDLIVSTKKNEMVEELSDLFNYCLLLADKLDVDILATTSEKIDKNALKYPTEVAKGTAKKYTELN